VPEQIAKIVHARHEREGVEILIGSGVKRASATAITLADGTDLAFDTVIAGVGAVPNTGLAETAGLEVDNGIVVDAAFRSSDPNIFAAGDCCNFTWRGNRVRLESWRAAQDQGNFVAASIMGAADEYAKVPWFWSDQFDLTLQVAGLFDLSRDILIRPKSDDTCIVFQCDAGEGGGLSAVAGIGPGNAIAKDVRICEKLIERKARVDPGLLIDPSFNLKQLLKAA
jgi:3-phenylpropionate/trans-cinnamate dioxygenase ferredoxin reductase subunit